MVRPSTKSAPTCTNHLVLVLCTPMWISEACQFFLVPSRSSSTPFYPSKVLRARKCAPTFYSFVVFCLGLTFESLKELGVHYPISFLFAIHVLSWQHLHVVWHVGAPSAYVIFQKVLYIWMSYFLPFLDYLLKPHKKEWVIATIITYLGMERWGIIKIQDL